MLKDIKVGSVTATSFIRRGNKKTSLFIILVLGLIFVNLVFFPALINGMTDYFVGAVKDYAYGDIVIEPAEDKAYIDDADSILQKIREVDGVKDAAKRLAGGCSVSYKDETVGANVLGVVPSEEERVSKYPQIVIEGEFLGELSSNEIMVGSILAGVGSAAQVYDNLGGVSVGSFVNVTYSNGVERTYKIKGIHEGAAEMTDMNILVHYQELEDVFQLQDKASSIIVRINDPKEGAGIKSQIIAAGVNEKVFTWQEKAEELIRQMIEVIDSLGILSKVISLIIGAALIFIIIYINTLNRKRELGILRAVGITSRSIVISYVLISLFYTILGIIVGLILFFSLTFYFQANPIALYESLTFSPVVDFWDLAENALIMMGMAVFAGLIPAWLVTRQNILNSIWGEG